MSDGQDERARRETADCDTLSREVAEVRQMVEDANQAVSVQPWTIEPEFDLANLGQFDEAYGGHREMSNN